MWENVASGGYAYVKKRGYEEHIWHNAKISAAIHYPYKIYLNDKDVSTICGIRADIWWCKIPDDYYPRLNFCKVCREWEDKYND